MSNNLHRYLDMLGLKVRDVVCGIEGVVDSVSFDLSGCVQCDVRPVGVDEKGELKKGYWLDHKRLVIVDNKPVMKRPVYEEPLFLEPGPSDKPDPMTRA